MTDKPNAVEEIMESAMDPGQGNRMSASEAVQRILAALDAAGLKVVPKQATEAMDDAGLDDPHGSYCDRCMHFGHVRNSGWPSVIWEQMLAAFDPAPWRPKPQSKKIPVEGKVS